MAENSSCPRRYSICAIPGDGIGPEVAAEGLRVLSRACTLHNVRLDVEEFAWGSEHYLKYGRMMPTNGLGKVEQYDAVYFGAVGSPEVPDEISAWGLLMPIRRHLDLFVNVRPVRCYPGVRAARAKHPDDVNILIVRENTEGEYANIGGRLYQPGQEMAIQTAVFTRYGIRRIIEYAFTKATTERSVRSITKSNALVHSMTLWDEVTNEVAASHPDIPCERIHVDAAAYRMVLEPESFHVVVGSNLFGDILSDLGAALAGSLGLAPSGNLNPQEARGLFEPVHGSAPDIAGRGTANPIGAILSGSMMLEFLGEGEVAGRVDTAVAQVLAQGIGTPDLGGECSTSELADEIIRVLA